MLVVEVWLPLPSQNHQESLWWSNGGVKYFPLNDCAHLFGKKCWLAICIGGIYCFYSTISVSVMLFKGLVHQNYTNTHTNIISHLPPVVSSFSDSIISHPTTSEVNEIFVVPKVLKITHLKTLHAVSQLLCIDSFHWNSFVTLEYFQSWKSTVSAINKIPFTFIVVGLRKPKTFWWLDNTNTLVPNPFHLYKLNIYLQLS